MKPAFKITASALLMIALMGVVGVRVQHFFVKEASTDEQQSAHQTYLNELTNVDTSLLIQKAKQEPAGQIVTPQTQEEIRKIYADITMKEMPRIFIDKLPDDFKISSVDDQTLFMKIATALMLRTNEKILNERKVVQILNEKFLNHIEWTDQETAYFNELVKKYDSDILRSKEGALESLINKVDKIPVSIGVAQAVYYSNWGQKNHASLFGEYGWVDKEHYAPLSYHSLIEACDNYALQMNSRSQMTLFVNSRRTFKPYEKERFIGVDLSIHLDKYMEFDRQYGKKIAHIFSQGYFKELDFACFKGECE